MRLSPFIAAALLAVSAESSWGAGAPAGTVVGLEGQATVLRGGQTVALAENASVASGDTLQVARDSRLQLHMQDDSLFSIPGLATLVIDSFKMPSGTGPGEALYTLKEGALRTITGRVNKGGGKYEMRTSQGTITVNGSAYSAMLCKGCTGFADGLYVKGESGVIVVTDAGGSVKLKPGQVAFASAAGGVPVLAQNSPFSDSVFAARLGADFGPNPAAPPPRIEPEHPASPS